jgi:hypothetical protein
MAWRSEENRRIEPSREMISALFKSRALTALRRWISSLPLSSKRDVTAPKSRTCKA